MQIKDLTTDELKALIRETISETLQELLDDPDRGKELRSEVKHRLSISLQLAETGGHGISVEEVAKKIGLTW